MIISRCGEIGRRKGFKIPRWKHRTGSSPVSGTSVVCLMGHDQFSKKLDYQFLVI